MCRILVQHAHELLFLLLNVGARVTLLLAGRMPGKNMRAKKHFLYAQAISQPVNDLK